MSDTSWELELRKAAMNGILFCDACLENWRRFREKSVLRYSEDCYHLELPSWPMIMTDEELRHIEQGKDDTDGTCPSYNPITHRCAEDPTIICGDEHAIICLTRIEAKRRKYKLTPQKEESER